MSNDWWSRPPDEWLRVRRAIIQAARWGRKHQVGISRWQEMVDGALARDPLKERAERYKLERDWGWPEDKYRPVHYRKLPLP